MTGKSRFAIASTVVTIVSSTSSHTVLLVTATRPLEDRQGERDIFRVKLAATHIARTQQVMQYCQSHAVSTKKEKMKLFKDPGHGLTFCVIEKNGSSFWRRVFYILLRPNSGKDMSVFDMSSVKIHKQSMKAPRSAPRNSSDHQEPTKSIKAMFARDPYERLFSGYVDKFFTLAAIGHKESVSINNNFPRSSTPLNLSERREENTAEDASSTSTTAFPGGPQDSGSQGCQPAVSIVTFQQFLRYVSNTRDISVNSHFGIQNRQCWPCLENYDVLGRMEHFHEDASFILRSVNVEPSSVFGTDDRFEESSALNIMEDMSIGTFDRFKSLVCMSRYHMMLRLWRVFQVRGYLSMEIPLPLSRAAATNTSLLQFHQAVRSAYSHTAGDRARVKSQRHAAMLEAYTTVPRSVLKAVERYVSEDCAVFGYECSVDKRFDTSTRQVKPVFRLDDILLLKSNW